MRIIEAQLADLQRHINIRLGPRAFRIATTVRAREWIRTNGTSLQYGARELKRVILRTITQPLALLVSQGRVEAGTRVTIDLNGDSSDIFIKLPSSQVEAA